jgi:hypothetical protein
MIPHAHVRGCPEVSGLGRFLHSAAVIARARSQYSEFRCLSQTSLIKPTIFSYTGIIVFGTEFNRAGAVIEVLCRYGECGSSDRVAIGAGTLDLVPSLLLQFLHPMLLIIGNGFGERHGPRHVEVSEGDNECFLFFRRHDMAHDATFVAGI